MTTQIDPMMIEGKTRPVSGRMCRRGHAKSHQWRCVDKRKSSDQDSVHKILGHEPSPPSRPPRHRCQAISKKCIHRSDFFLVLTVRLLSERFCSSDHVAATSQTNHLSPQWCVIAQIILLRILLRSNPFGSNPFGSNPFG